MTCDNCKDLMEETLRTNGYDGLYWSYGVCSCDLDHLMICGGYCGDCEPGYKIKDKAALDGWRIVADKPEDKWKGEGDERERQ